jgi:hypothetical protein
MEKGREKQGESETLTKQRCARFRISRKAYRDYWRNVT